MTDRTTWSVLVDMLIKLRRDNERLSAQVRALEAALAGPEGGLYLLPDTAGPLPEMLEASDLERLRVRLHRVKLPGPGRPQPV